MNEKMCVGLLSMDYREFQKLVIRYCGRNRKVLYWLTHTNVKKGISHCSERATLHEALYVRSVFAIIGYPDPLKETLIMATANKGRSAYSNRKW